MVHFRYTILYVQDVTKSISFYERAFGFKRKFIAEGNEYGELATGDTTLSFASVELGKMNLADGFIESSIHNKPFGIEMGFTTENVEQAFDTAIESGAIAVSKAQTKPWGQKIAYVRDPDGFLIELCTPIG
jgi:uncharacterized glyoxalase superfamily protein PhnB